jgi:hypothetical protein
MISRHSPEFKLEPIQRGEVLKMERLLSNRNRISDRGKVRIDSRGNGRYRLRFNYIHEDQLELVLSALENARTESETEYDSVALTNICVHYLACG